MKSLKSSSERTSKRPRKTSVLDGIAKIFGEALSLETEEQLGKSCLSIAEEITQSGFGFIGEINGDGKLDDIAISDPGWEACRISNRSGHGKLPGGFTLNGIAGRVLIDGKSLFSNTPGSHPDSIATPEGHPQLEAFLGVPLIRDGRTIGILALGNRPGGYTDKQVKDMEAFAPAIVQALFHKRAERALRESEFRERARAAELAALMNSLPVITFIARDLECREMFSNRAATEFLRLPENTRTSLSAALDQRPTAFRPFRNGRELQSAELPLQLAAATGKEVRNFDLTLAFPDGTCRDLLGNAAPLFDEHGHVRGAVGAFLDNTERIQATELLRESEERYRGVVEHTSAIILRLDPEGVIRFANGRALDFFGYSEEELIGKHAVGTIIPAQDTAGRDLAAMVAQIAREPDRFHYNSNENMRKNGERVWLEWTNSGVYDAGGNLKEFLAVGIDTTERYRAEKALRESESKYRQLFDSMTEGFLLVEPIYDGIRRPVSYRYLDANKALESLTLLKREDILGKDVRDVLPNIEPYWIESINRVAKTGIPERIEQFSKDLNAWYDVQIDCPEPGKAALIYRNTTEKKQVEETLRSQRTLLNTILDNIPVVLCIWNPRLSTFRFNEYFRKILGWDEISAGSDFMEKVYPDPDYRKQVIEYMLSYEGGWRDLKSTAKNGSIIDISWANIRLEDGTSMGIGIDVRERKRMEDGLRMSRRELERRVQERTAELTQTVETLGEEVAERIAAEQRLRDRTEQLRSLATELTLTEQRERMRLAQVLHDGLQQILVAAKYRAASAERAPKIREAMRELSELLDDAIETSRSLTSELSPPILKEGGLVPALEWLARWMRDRHGLEVGLTMRDKRDKIDRASEETVLLLFQATRELLFNVVKHASAKSAHVEVSQDGNSIRIRVKDDGVGFDPSRIRGEQGHSGGFGLFSIRERIGLFGGTIDIHSAPGQGSRFELSVPAAPADIRTHAEPSETVPAVISLWSQKESSRSGGKIRIVLVDDHMIVRQGLAGLLHGEPDFEIIGEASDGASAINLVRESRPDVVLMDLSMPGVNGIEATRIIHGEMPDIQIIGLSMFEESEKADEMRRAGAADYLTKSGPSDELISAIRTTVQSFRTAASRQPS